MFEFLRREGIDESIIREIELFREQYPVEDRDRLRIPVPKYKYYGTDVWQKAITALLQNMRTHLL